MMDTAATTTQVAKPIEDGATGTGATLSELYSERFKTADERNLALLGHLPWFAAAWEHGKANFIAGGEA